ncbi:hypothetical protein CB1_000740055 [Camelus ferus]|nr:hypothetical protein CB1_000740055 [Camelus ferus]
MGKGTEWHSGRAWISDWEPGLQIADHAAWQRGARARSVTPPQPAAGDRLWLPCVPHLSFFVRSLRVVDEANHPLTTSYFSRVLTPVVWSPEGVYHIRDQPPESKPNFTPLAILAPVLGAIQPYAHLIHVQRLLPHQCSASSSTLFPAIQTCTCFLTGQKKRFAKTPGFLSGFTFEGGRDSFLLYPFILTLGVSMPFRKAKALYACKAEHDSELSFTAGTVFDNVHPSQEPGWLEGTLNGKTGLIPENYVEFL